MSKKATILGADEQQFEHDVVGEDHVWWMLPHRLTFIVTRLAGVLCEPHREGLTGALFVLHFELVQPLKLRVHQRIHRVHHQRDKPLIVLGMANDVIDDGQEIREAFAGAGAASDDENFYRRAPW